MKRMRATIATIILATASAFPALAQQGPLLTVDRIELKSGETVDGLIVSRSPNGITVRTENGEVSYPMDAIRRIQDESEDDLSYTKALGPGELPPWRVIINDIRNYDEIVRFEEIPPVRLESGAFRNVPYKSFRGNRRLELNLYGDLQRPAGIEIGIYGPDSRDERLRRLARRFMATYMGSRGEVGALYDIPLTGGIAEVGPTVIRIQSPDEPDSHGAWWISIYNKRALERARVPPAQYEKVTFLADQVRNPDGSIVDDPWSQNANAENIPALAIGMGQNKLYLRGFYRDETGKFHLINVSDENPTASQNSPTE